jgi:hypothetical protein
MNLTSRNSKMRFVPILVLILCNACSTKQGKDRFETLVYDLSNKSDSIEFEQWRLKNVVGKESKKYDCQDSLKIDEWTWAHCLYEDDLYKVLGGCRGEFGGSVIFIPKIEPGKANYMTCTCPGMIEKREDGFYITETLAHMSGSGRIIKVRDPEELITISTDSLPLAWKVERFKGLDSHEIYRKLAGQGQTLIDTIGYSFTLFFQLRGYDYLIFSDYNTTYLGKLKDNDIVLIDTLVKAGTWGYTDVPGEVIGDIYHSGFERKYGTGAMHKYSSGDIYVKQDTIVIGYSYKEWPRREGEF